MDGFADQRLCVVPQPAVQAATQRAVTRRLVVTDAGYFPEARAICAYEPLAEQKRSSCSASPAGDGWTSRESA